MGLLIGDIDPEADDASRVDADECTIEARFGVSGRIDRFRADSGSPDSGPAKDRVRDVVDDERCPAIVGDVAELATARQAVALDVDGIQFGVVSGPDRVDLQGSVGCTVARSPSAWEDKIWSSAGENDMVIIPLGWLGVSVGSAVIIN